MGSSALERIAISLERLATSHESIANQFARLVDAVAPAPSEKVGTAYVAKKLGQTTVWIAEMARRGKIPGNCIVTGTGIGKPWKFHRGQIDKWLESR